MIGMVESVGSKQILGVAGDQHIGLHPADDAHHVAAQVDIWDQGAVLPVKEMDRFHAQRRGGGRFFLVTQIAKFVAGNIMIEVVAAFVAAGQQIILNVMPVPGPACQRSAAKKFRVIRMGQDDQDILRLFPGTKLCFRSHSFCLCRSHSRRFRDGRRALRICAVMLQVRPTVRSHPGGRFGRRSALPPRI